MTRLLIPDFTEEGSLYPMRIAIDGTLISERPKGVSRYLTNLLAQLAVVDQTNEYHVFVDRQLSTQSLPNPERFRYRPVNFRSNLHWKLFALRKILAEESFDLVHLPSESRVVSTPCACVVTVHEIAQTKWRLEKKVGPYQVLQHILNEWHFRHSIDKVAAVIAVSQATRNELIKLYPVDKQKVVVVHEAPDPRLINGAGGRNVDQVRAQLSAPRGFILSFATGDSRENVEAVLAAFRVISEHVPHQLVFCGTRPLVEKLLRQSCESLGIMERVSILGFVDDTTLAGLYAAADLYVDISYYEGFGLQACEAMAAGVPVIASNIPAFLEVLGAAGVFVGAEDTKALARAMQEILSNHEEWQRRSRLCRERGLAYSWKRAAEQTLAVYRSFK